MKYLIFLFTFLTINLTAEELVVISLSELKANQHKYSGKTIVTQGKLYWSSSILNARTKIYLKEDNKFGKTFLLQLNPLEFKSEQLKKGNLVNIRPTSA